MMRRMMAALAVVTMSVVLMARADDSKKKPDEAGTIQAEAAQKQIVLEKRFQDLSVKLRTLAERMARSTNKAEREKAQQLQDALKLASEAQVGAKFRTLIDTLNKAKAPTVGEADEALDQSKQVLETLEAMLNILMSEGKDAERKAEIERLTNLLKQINQVIRDQKIVRRKTETEGMDPEKLKGAQAKVEDNAKDLHGKLGGEKGAPAKTKDAEKGNAKDGANKPKGGEGDAKSGKDSKGNKEGDAKSGKGDKGGPPDDGGKKGGDKGDKGPKDDSSKGDKGDKAPMDDGNKKGGDKADPKDGKGDGDAKSGKDSKGAGEGDGKPKGDPKDGGGQGKPSKAPPSAGQPGQGPPGGDGKPGDPPPPAQAQPNKPTPPPLPGRREVQEAIAKMGKAKDMLPDPKAAKPQDDAIDKLDEARAELEKLLKQKRDEEFRAKLAELKARCELMLAMQEAVYKGTVETHKSVLSSPDKKAGKGDIFKSQQLAESEGEIVKEARRAIGLLENEGHSVAFTELFRQMKDDMELVQNRLGKTDVAEFTQQREEEIIQTLKDMIKALEKAMKDSQAPPPPPGKPGTPPPPPPDNLLDKIAELKLIKARQEIVNKRTTDYAKSYPGEQAETPDILEELKKLGKDQGKLQKIVTDMATKKNE